MTHSPVGVFASYQHPALAIIAEAEIDIDAFTQASVTTVDDGGTPRVSAVASVHGPARSFPQGTMGNRPAYVAGKHFLFSNARPDFLSLAETSGLNWANGTLIAVYKPVDTAAFSDIFCVGDGTTARLEFALNSTERPRITINATGAGADATIAGTGPISRTVTCGHWQDGVSLTVESTFGTTVTDATYSTPVLTYTDLIIGRRADATRPLSAELNQLLFWEARRSAGDIAYLFQYLRGKWAA